MDMINLIFTLQIKFGGIKSMKQISIAYYAPFFHDGSIININHYLDKIEIFMQSAQVEEEDLKDNIILSKFHRIKGGLNLENVSSIEINDILFFGKLKMLYDKGSIFDFILQEKEIELQIAWVNFPPNPNVNEFSVIRICAEKIWWENIPDLFDPFW